MAIRFRSSAQLDPNPCSKTRATERAPGVLVLLVCATLVFACSPPPPDVRPDASGAVEAVDAGDVDAWLTDAGLVDAGSTDAGARELQLPMGAAWVKLTTPPSPGKQDDIHFIDGERGWYANGDGKLYRTVNGGAEWTEVLSRPGTYWRALGFIDADTGLLGNIGVDSFPGVSDDTPLYITRNGGSTITPVTFTGPRVKGICAVDVLPVEFINAGKLERRVVVHAGGRVGGPAHLLRSLDGGETWRSLDLGNVIAMITDVKFFSESVGFVVGGSNASVAASRAVILKTTDGGDSWTKVYESARPYELIWKVSFPDPQHGFATVQSYAQGVAQQRVVKTIDSGATWVEKPLVMNNRARQFGIGFISPNVGWVGTAVGGFETRDGAETWRPVELGLAANKLRVVRSGDSFVAYAIGLDVYKLDARRP